MEDLVKDLIFGLPIDPNVKNVTAYEIENGKEKNTWESKIFY